MRFLLGSSFFSNTPFKREVDAAWHHNLQRMDVRPASMVSIWEGGLWNHWDFRGRTQEVNLTGDLGHIGAHLNNSKPHHLTGWSASMCALAMLAYVDEADFIYKESDCLAFGPWVPKMYEDIGDGEFLFGPPMTSAPWMSCAQSLFMVKHHFIPAFVSTYLSLGPDRAHLGEDKFIHVANCYPNLTRKLSFGVDRMRPIPWDDKVFYFQQPTPEELAECYNRNLL